MENASKALYMAGSLLIALLIVGLLVYAFNQMGGIQDEKDKIEDEESVVAFNKEFEVYNKRIMAGTDVISCINKAVSVNEKYVKGSKFFTGTGEGNGRLVDVQITNDLILTDEIRWYLIDHRTGKEREGTNGEIPSSFSSLKMKTAFGEMGDYFTTLNNNTTVASVLTSSTPIAARRFKSEDMHLLTNTGERKYNQYNQYNFILKDIFITNNASLYTLVNTSSKLELIYENPNKNDGYSWTYIKWRLPIYQFKKMSFRCAGMEYDQQSGYLKTIFIEEYH